jgi:hypothetical protein
VDMGTTTSDLMTMGRAGASATCSVDDPSPWTALGVFEAIRSVVAHIDRRLAEPDLEFRAFCARKGLPASSTLQLERAWDAWQAERYRRGETGQRPGYTDNPFRPR